MVLELRSRPKRPTCVPVFVLVAQLGAACMQATAPGNASSVAAAFRATVKGRGRGAAVCCDTIKQLHAGRAVGTSGDAVRLASM